MSSSITSTPSDITSTSDIARVFIDIVEIENWNMPSVFSLSGGSDPGFDDYEYIRPSFSRPWTKRTRFSNGASGQEECDGLTAGDSGDTTSQVVQDIIQDPRFRSWRSGRGMFLGRQRLNFMEVDDQGRRRTKMV
jgi:hypothetical protein